MSDSDIINRMSKIQKKDDERVTLEQIMSEVPMINYQTPLLYELYLYYNNHNIEDNERMKLENIISTLKYNQMTEIKKNLEYLTPH